MLKDPGFHELRETRGWERTWFPRPQGRWSFRRPGTGPRSADLLGQGGQRSAEKRRSKRFALTEYSESRFEGLKEASTTPEIAARIPTLVGSTRRGEILTPCHTRHFTASWWSEGSASSRSRASSWCIGWCPPNRASNTTTWPASSTRLWA